MHALVVFESMWGNTRAVAEAVGRGIQHDAAVVNVGHAPKRLAADVDLLVVGGPTHAFSMSRPGTRHDAVQRGATEGDGTHGIREWLEAMPSSEGIDVATFDTRVVKMKKLPGSAAKAAGKDVRRHHLGDLVATESFFVEDASGPLVEGELARAESWGAELAAHRDRLG
jgi:hypothetical protein